jgi:hypothetical protein
MGNYTPIGACQQDITFSESLRDSTKKAEGDNVAYCYLITQNDEMLLHSSAVR